MPSNSVIQPAFPANHTCQATLIFDCVAVRRLYPVVCQLVQHCKLLPLISLSITGPVTKHFHQLIVLDAIASNTHQLIQGCLKSFASCPCRATLITQHMANWSSTMPFTPSVTVNCSIQTMAYLYSPDLYIGSAAAIHNNRLCAHAF